MFDCFLTRWFLGKQCKWSYDVTAQILKTLTILIFLRYTSQLWTSTVLSMLDLYYHRMVSQRCERNSCKVHSVHAREYSVRDSMYSLLVYLKNFQHPESRYTAQDVMTFTYQDRSRYVTDFQQSCEDIKSSLDNKSVFQEADQIN